MRYDLVDATGNTAERVYNIVGSTYQHYSRGKWTVVAPVWHGETDTWQILHVNILMKMYATRSWDNFFGTIESGGFRFRKV